MGDSDDKPMGFGGFSQFFFQAKYHICLVIKQVEGSARFTLSRSQHGGNRCQKCRTF
jgi:hypothetical protein